MALTRVGGDLLKKPLNIGTGVTITSDGNATFSGIVTAANFVDAAGNPITGGGAGLGTAVSAGSTVGGEQIYYTNTVLTVTGDLTIDPPDSSNIAYTQYQEIAVEDGFDLIVEDGDDLVPDILGLSTGTAAPLAGAGGRVRADQFTNKAGTGAPTFPNGIAVSGTSTFGNTVVGGATTELIVNGDARVTGILTIGTSSITLDGSENQVSVGTGVTLHHTNGVQVGGNTVHSSGIAVNDINASGIITSTSIVVGDKFINSSGVGLGTTTTAGRNAGVGTAIGTLIYNETSSSVEVYKGSRLGWKNIAHSFVQATGGQISDYVVGSTVYRAHIFNTSDIFSVENVGPGSVDLLLIAGGGGGGGSWTNSTIGNGGGGGAGGLFYRPVAITYGDNPVVIGAGGIGDGYQQGGNTGTDGSDSTALDITADGGGRGGSYGSPGYAGGAGGSGGGAGYGQVVGSATGVSVSSVGVDLISPPAGWGRNGGDYSGTAPVYGAGGGGGAAYAGTSGSGTSGGPGGDGLQYTVVGFTTYYAGGGGGGSDSGNPAGTGGIGGGGAGSTNAARATNAIENTGSGGGGGGNGPGSSVGQGGNGGSGIAVIRYEIADLTAAAKATGGYISYVNGKTIHKFEKTGVFTITDPSLTSVDALVIGGGGGGGTGTPGAHYGGGGGAGALHYQTNFPVSDASPYAVSIGAGGAATWYPTSNGTSGLNSVFSTITASGGGAGRGVGPGNAFGGGSGGGAAYPAGSGGSGSGDTGGTDNSVSPANGWGNDGADYSSGGQGGGGGGAGGVGGVVQANNADGGLGLSYNISGTSVTYATGGRGGHSSPGAAGESYTGNGGGGGRGIFGPGNIEANTNGGSGIVIIAYPS